MGGTQDTLTCRLSLSQWSGLPRSMKPRRAETSGFWAQSWGICSQQDRDWRYVMFYLEQQYYMPLLNLLGLHPHYFLRTVGLICLSHVH